MKRQLAYVSPLPPENTGIAGYSADLLPALATHYHITVITEQPQIDDVWIITHCPSHDAAWLRSNREQFDTVLYHFGNSAFHAWMFDLLSDVPGTVVLHDFYLGGLLSALPQGRLHEELLYSHGYSALATTKTLDDTQLAIRFPVNRHVTERATGIIVHSPSTLTLGMQWLGKRSTIDWHCIPLTRRAIEPTEYAKARETLSISPLTYLVCSFGLLGTPKRNLDLLVAWLGSALADDSNSHLIFVGEPTEPDYQRQMEQLIEASGLGERIHITGWVSQKTYRLYLSAADLAVQLRMCSRGETSAAVLDCLNHHLPTIINDHASMADLPADAVYHLPDNFTPGQLAQALKHFRDNPKAGAALGRRGQELIESQHRPEYCAALYHQALLSIESHPPQSTQRPQLLVDISESCRSRSRSRTGIERVARALALALCEQAPTDLSVVPVYLSQDGDHWHYRHAHIFFAEFSEIHPPPADTAVVHRPGDQLVLLDLCVDVISAHNEGLFDSLRQTGTRCLTLLHDLLPCSRPEFFPPDTQLFFQRWLEAIVSMDGAIAASRTVAEQLHTLISERGKTTTFTITHSAHGADLSASGPSRGLPENSGNVFDWMGSGPCVLMVGTLEPRKGHLQALEAFSLLWEAGFEVNLLIVGCEGWRGVADEHRLAVAELVHALNTHPQRGKQLRWLDNASDEYLELIYQHASGLLAASWDEGFGLPLIEAAHHGVPILARDTPIFREVAGPHAQLFTAKAARELSTALQAWIEGGFHPPSDDLPYLTWHQSAKNLLRAIGGGRP